MKLVRTHRFIGILFIIFGLATIALDSTFEQNSYLAHGVIRELPDERYAFAPSFAKGPIEVTYTDDEGYVTSSALMSWIVPNKDTQLGSTVVIEVLKTPPAFLADHISFIRRTQLSWLFWAVSAFFCISGFALLWRDKHV